MTMRMRTVDTHAANRTIPQTLVHTNSLLLVSGLMVGLGINLALSHQIQHLLATFILSGVVGCVFWDAVTRHRQRTRQRRAIEQLNWHLESRLHRHIPLRQSPRVAKLAPASDHSFLCVNGKKHSR